MLGIADRFNIADISFQTFDRGFAILGDLKGVIILSGEGHPRGTTFMIYVNMCVQGFSEKGDFLEWGSDLSRSGVRVHCILFG